MNEKNSYYRMWRNKRSRHWHYIQLKWYHGNKRWILLGFSKPSSSKPDLYDRKMMKGENIYE